MNNTVNYEVISNWQFSAFAENNETGEYDVPFSPEGFYKNTSRKIVGEYEETTIDFGFAKSNVPYHEQKFIASFSCQIPAGNLIEVLISSDDTASILVGNLSANSTLYHSGIAQSSYVESPKGTLNVIGTYTNIGGPYNLHVTIKIKSKWKFYFRTQCNTPDDYQVAKSLPENERQDYLDKRKLERTIFGCGEYVELCLSNALEYNIMDLCIAYTEECDDSLGVLTLNTRKTQNESVSFTLAFEGGERITRTAKIKIPESEIFEKIPLADSPKDLVIWYPPNEIGAALYLKITIAPTDVAFNGLYIWEKPVTPIRTGIFEENPESSKLPVEHIPALPLELVENIWYDTAFYIIKNPRNLIPVNCPTDENGHLGTLTWICPIRWAFDNPGTFESDGDKSLPNRTQIVTVDFIDDITYISIEVSKGGYSSND